MRKRGNPGAAVIEAMERRAYFADTTLVGHIGGWVNAVAVNGSSVCAGMGQDIVVLDATQPSSPRLIGTARLPAVVQDIAWAGNYAYVADGEAGLRVVDLSSTSAPVQVGSYLTGGTAQSICVVGTHAYIAADTSFQVIDISDPTAPVLAARYDESTRAFGVSVQGGYAYVGAYTGGIQILSIADPSRPEFVSEYQPPAIPGVGSSIVLNVEAEGPYLFAVDGVQGLHILDISNPQSPTLLGRLPPDGYSQGVAVVGGRAYFGQGGGMVIADVSQPEDPVVIGRVTTSAVVKSVRVEGNVAYVADAEGGLMVVDVTNPAVPTAVGGFAIAGDALKSDIAGSYAYVASGFQGLQILNVRDLSNPSFVADVGGTAWDVKVVGNYAYVAGGNDLIDIVDVSSPAAPIIVGKIHDITVSSSSLAILGRYAVVTGWNTLRVIDISDPTSPTVVGGLSLAGMGYEVVTDGSLAYVADGYKGLAVVDISNPVAPVPVSEFPVGGDPCDVKVAGGLAYVACMDFGVSIADVTTPSSPRIIGKYETGSGTTGVAVDGTNVYVADGMNRIDVLDVADPQTPVLECGYTVAAPNGSIFMSGSYALVSDGYNGLVILDTAARTSAPGLIGLSSDNVPNRCAPGTAIGTLSAADHAGYGGTTYSLVAGTGSDNNGAFQVVGTDLRITLSPDYGTEASYSIRVRATNSSGWWNERAFTVTVAKPTDDIHLSSANVVEFRPALTKVGLLSDTVPDGRTFAYSLPPSLRDNRLFTVVGNQLLTAASFSYAVQSSYSILVKSVDQNGVVIRKAFTINVDQDHAPTNITLSSTTVAGNMPVGTRVGVLRATDPDAGEVFTYMLPPSFGDNQYFQIVNGKLKTNAVFDASRRTSYRIKVRATDLAGKGVAKVFSITIGG